jgi:BirA family biotin operon repressor/biotin-[acetyl-CoA-carboxylase] ligase
VALPPLPGGERAGARGSDASASRPTWEVGHPHPTLSLEGEGLSSLLIKWPNDVLLGGAKLSGILLERADDAVVVGFGVNLAHHPIDLDRAATSLAASSGNVPDPDTFLSVLADSFARWLHRWRQDGLAAILTAWLARAHPIGTALTVRLPSANPTPFVLSEVEGHAASAAPATGTSISLRANGEGGAPIDDSLHGLFDGLDRSGALRLRLADGSVRVIHAADVFMIQD